MLLPLCLIREDLRNKTLSLGEKRLCKNTNKAISPYLSAQKPRLMLKVRR